MPNKKLQVFVSSTYLDLKEERQAAVAAILKAGHIPAGMELFTAGDESQWDTITRWIDESDIYMLILGGRYGSTHPDTGAGYTEMEYDYAVSQKKPVFAVVIHDKELDQRIRERGKDVLELDNRPKLDNFRDKVLSKISTFFSDVKDIRLAVHEVIPNLEQRHSLKGWISGSEFSNNAPLVEELARINDENRQLRKELDSLKASAAKAKAPDSAESFEKLKDILKGVVLDTSDLRIEGIGEKTNLLVLFYLYKESIAAGVTNAAGSSQLRIFLYYNVCAALEIHELVESEKVPSAKYRRYFLTPRGKKFLAFLQDIMAKSPRATG